MYKARCRLFIERASILQSLPELTLRKYKTPTIADEGLLFWWAHQDLNLGPKDSGLCDFHHSLDYAFTV